jgi:hypothetical protein
MTKELEALKLALEALEDFAERGCPMHDSRETKGVVFIRKEWVGLTEEEVIEISHLALTRVQAVQMTQAKLKEKNT